MSATVWKLKMKNKMILSNLLCHTQETSLHFKANPLNSISMLLNVVTFCFLYKTQVVLNLINYSLTLIWGRRGTLKKGYNNFVRHCLKIENEKQNDFIDFVMDKMYRNTQETSLHFKTNPLNSISMLLNAVTYCFLYKARVILNLISYSLTLIRGRGDTLIKKVTLVLSAIVWKFKIKNEMTLSFQKVPIINNRETSILKDCNKCCFIVNELLRYFSKH